MKKLILIAPFVISLFVPCVFAESTTALVNINKADVADLDELDGIGKKKAEAIISYRDAHGEFKALEELQEVPGIGEKLFEKLKDHVSLGEADGATSTAEAAPDTKNTDKQLNTADKAKSEAPTEKTDTKAGDSAKKVSATDKSEKVSDKTSEQNTKSWVFFATLQAGVSFDTPV